MTSTGSTGDWNCWPVTRRSFDAGRLRGLAGLRNRLVHVYAEIDDSRVHAMIGTGLPDLDAFAGAVARLVDRSR